jgi:hypothetical protein
MNDRREFLEWYANEERKRMVPCPPLPPIERPTIHYTELPEATAAHQLCTEWNFYRSQVARLLAEGQQGRWILIVGQEIIGIWDTFEEALQVKNQRFPFRDVVLRQILEREPILRGGGWHRRWAS